MAVRVLCCALIIAFITACSGGGGHVAVNASPANSASPSTIANAAVAESPPPPPHVWTEFQGNLANNAVYGGSLTARWSVDTGGKINGGLAFANNVVYATSFSKKVFAIDAATGKVLWTAPTPNIVMSTPIVSHGVVVVGTGTNASLPTSGVGPLWGRPAGDDVIAFRVSDGAKVWSFHTIGEDMPTPAVIGDKLIFGNGDRHAYALDIRTGKLLWSTPIPGVTSMSGTAISNGIAYIYASGAATANSASPSHLLALSTKTGKLLWSALYGNSDCSPVILGDLVACEGSVDVPYGASGSIGSMGKNDVEAYDVKTGNLVWRWLSDVGYYSTTVSNERGIAAMAHGGVLYQAIPVSDEFAAFRLSDGALLWKRHTAGPVKMSAVYHNGLLFYGDTAGVLYIVNASDGSLNNVGLFDHPFSVSPPIIVGGTLFIVNGSRVTATPLYDLIDPGPRSALPSPSPAGSDR